MSSTSTAMPASAREFCERFGVTVPIVNAPMATIAGGALAAAVAGAGGVGMIGGGYGDLAWIRTQRALADDADVGVGLITWRLAEQPDLVARLIADGYRTYFLSFGDPTPYAPTILDAGGLLICQIHSVAEAERAIACGASAVVAQGQEAGGHGRSGASVVSLVREVVTAVDPVPVLIAGGITTGRDLAAAWALGAAGAVLGTRLYATPEALDSNAAKRRLVDASDHDTIRTRVFDVVRGPEWPAGYDARALRNAATDEWHDRLDSVRENPAPARDHYADAVAADDLTRRVVWAGSGVGRINSIHPAATIVDAIVAEALESRRDASTTSSRVAI